MKSLIKSIVVSIITWEAKIALRRYQPKIIAVTGNVGKTSTKDAIFAVVSKAFSARKSEKSFNSEFGLPLTILGLDTAWSSPRGWLSNIKKGFVVALFSRDFPQWLVLEVGADHPGDIESVVEWLYPDIVVLTRMSDVPVHVEYFKDAADVLREKMFLAQALRPGGTLVVNSDDLYFEQAVKDMPVKKLFYGATPGASVQILESGILYENSTLPLPRGQYAVMKMGEKQERIEVSGILGEHLMYPIAAACSVGTVLGIQSEILAAFLKFDVPKGRMRILSGLSGSSIVDDTYNSSPLAAKEALKAMASLSIRGRKIAALADMKELGENSEKAHRSVGRMAGQELHTLVTVGEMSKWIDAGALESGMALDRIHHFDTSNEAADALSGMVRAGDVILVKGSQSMRMEKVSKALLADQSKATQLLVRQEDEWKER